MLKTFKARIKAATDDPALSEGQFRALVSVFGVKDAMGDVVVPGAFADTLTEWSERGDPIPIYWSHQMQDPDYNIGWADPENVRETEDGLEVVGDLDLEDGGPAKAKQVYRLLKGRRVTDFSFAYDVVDGGPVEKDGDSYNELRALKLYELGPTPIGANPATELLAVKHDLKRGRVLSAKNEAALNEALGSITAAVASIKNVLAAVAPPDDDGKDRTTQEKAIALDPATDKEPSQATPKEPSRSTPVTTLAAHLALLDMEGTA